MKRPPKFEYLTKWHRNNIHTKLFFEEVDHWFLALFDDDLIGVDGEDVHRQPTGGLAHNWMLFIGRVERNIDESPIVLAEDLNLFFDNWSIWVGKNRITIDGDECAVRMGWIQIVWEVEGVHLDSLW